MDTPRDPQNAPTSHLPLVDTSHSLALACTVRVHAGLLHLLSLSMASNPSFVSWLAARLLWPIERRLHMQRHVSGSNCWITRHGMWAVVAVASPRTGRNMLLQRRASASHQKQCKVSSAESFGFGNGQTKLHSDPLQWMLRFALRLSCSHPDETGTRIVTDIYLPSDKIWRSRGVNDMPMAM